MFVSNQLKEKNIVEYLLYMWQVEDLVRAHGGDVEKIRKLLVDACPLSEEQKAEWVQWVADLVEMMRREGVMEKGHLQINRNVVSWLTDLHARLMRSSRFPYYHAAYYNALPCLVELRTKGVNRENPETETGMELLYGIWMLRLQKKEIGAETKQAQELVAAWLAQLSAYYAEDKKGTLKWE